jgi:ABC-type dipeptide/oligopeptide/nickel transport system ATPase component
MISDDPRQKQLKKYAKILPEEWRENQLAATTEAIYKEITAVAIAAVQQDIAKAMDPDLAKLRAQVKDANHTYSEGKKVNTTKIEFLVDNLKSRGVDVPSAEDFLSAAAKRLLESEKQS